MPLAEKLRALVCGLKRYDQWGDGRRMFLRVRNYRRLKPNIFTQGNSATNPQTGRAKCAALVVHKFKSLLVLFFWLNLGASTVSTPGCIDDFGFSTAKVAFD
jgi:hypothetical protein